MMRTHGYLVLALAPLLGACVPLQSAADFRTEIARQYPPGSAEADLRQQMARRGFVEGRPFGPPVDQPTCLRRQISYWMVVAGDRYVCFTATTDGRLIEVVPNEFVMSP